MSQKGADRYVKAVVKKVKCSVEKKKEIKKQLLSDINIAVEEGEKIEDIIKSMGSVEEVAEEFNSNLSETELKKYKNRKRLKIVFTIAAILIIIVSGVRWVLPDTMVFGTSGLFEEQAVEEQMKHIIFLLNENDYETLMENSIKEMEYVLDENTLNSIKGMISDDWGQFEEFGNIYLMEVKQRGHIFALGQITVLYENVTITYQITLDKNMRLAGFYMR